MIAAIISTQEQTGWVDDVRFDRAVALFDQLIGRRRRQYDWAKFAWIGSAGASEYQMYMRAGHAIKTIEDGATQGAAALRGAGDLGYRPIICRSCSKS